VLVLLFFCVSSLADTRTQRLEEGYFPGRSGDFVVVPKLIPEDDSFIAFVNPPISEPSIPFSTVGDLLSHLSGLPSLSSETNRSFFPEKSFFEKPKSNLLFVIDGSPHLASRLAVLREVTHNKLESPSYPANTLSQVYTLLSSVNASKHGIINNKWFDKHSGVEVTAFESWCPGFSGPATASIADLATLAKKNSLIVSASSNFQVARAIAAKDYVVTSDSHNYGFYWDEGTFKSIYPDHVVELLVNYATITEYLASKFNSFKGGLGMYFEDDEILNMAIPGDKDPVPLDLEDKDVLAFIAEISFINLLPDALLQKPDLYDLVYDETPDYFTFSFSSIKNLQTKYGPHSEQLRAVFGLIDKTISVTIAKLRKIYGDELNIEVAVVGQKPEALSNVEVEYDIKERIKLLPEIIEEHVDHYFPNVYLVESISDEEREVACYNLQQNLLDLEAHVHCMPKFTGQEKHMYGKRSSEPSQDEVEIFQIVLWSSVVLIIAGFFASLIMCTIDASKDPMLYLNTADPYHMKSM